MSRAIEFKLKTPGANRAIATLPESAVPAPSKPVRGASLPPNRKSVTFYPSKDAWLQLRMLSGRTDTTVQGLMLVALDLLFAKNNLQQFSESRE